MSYAWIIGLLGIGLCSCAAAATQIVAHRGESSVAPENTLAAVKLAWERNPDAVEIDVHLSKDRRMVVMHDPTTGRTGTQDLRVSETDSEELRKLDVGRHKGELFAGEKMPFFEEILETVPEGKLLFVEIKCGREILPLLKSALDSTGKADRVMVISFNLAVCAAAKRIMPKVPVCLLWGPTKDEQTGDVTAHDSDKLIGLARSNNLDGVDVHYSGVTEGFARAIKESGLMLHVWTVNDLQEVKRLRKLGVTGITTDRPGYVLANT